MERLYSISNKCSSAKKPNESESHGNQMEKLKIESKRMQISSKKIQIVEDHRRILEEKKAESTIDGEALKLFMFGHTKQLKDRLHDFMRLDPDISDYRAYEIPSDTARLRTNQILVKVMRKFPLTTKELRSDILKQAAIFESLSVQNAGVATKYAVNNFLYAKTIIALGNENHMELVQRALENRDFGCFALTEIAHGSNVQGMVTTATYDPNLDKFVVNSLSERGIKFWIGNAAQTANMAVVFANLIVEGRNYGIHAFVVTIRKPNDHTPMPGVLIGDCGPKFGLNGVDNGYLSFRNVRIPRENLLDKVTQVAKGGKVTSLFEKKSKRFAVQLSALSDGRVKIAYSCASAGFKCLAIAIRYCAQRRQFGSKGRLEQSLLDYPSIQNRILPYFATFMVSFFSGKSLLELWNQNYKNVIEEENDQIKEMHALISIAKPLVSEALIKCSNEVRMVCGGHGYSSYSGIPSLIQDYHVMVTWEGDNHVLSQQTAKFVIKNYMKLLLKGQKPKFATLDYLLLEKTEEEKCPPFQNYEELKNPENLLVHLKYTALRAVLNCVSFQQNIMDGRSRWEQWNAAIPYGLENVSNTYGILYSFRNALDYMEKITVPQNKEYLRKLIVIYGLNNLKEASNVLAGYFNQEHLAYIDHAMLQLLDDVKHDILSHCDYLYLGNVELSSTIGAEEGGIYENIFSSLLSNGKNFGRPDWWREIWKYRNGKFDF